MKEFVKGLNNVVEKYNKVLDDERDKLHQEIDRRFNALDFSKRKGTLSGRISLPEKLIDMFRLLNEASKQ